METEIVSIAKALGDESRLRIMMCLEGTTLCQCQLTEILGLAPSTVSQHVGMLCSAGLLEGRREGRWHYYRWPRESASACVNEALAWVRNHVTDDPHVKADAAKRAVVMRNSQTPCPKEAKTRVLFLCTGNSCRSQMAEAMLREYSAGHFEVHSAGLEPKPIHELTYDVMDEIGIAEQIQWEFEDPAAFEGSQQERLDQTRHVRDAIRARIDEWTSTVASIQ
ncbi:MAG: metalloregulator ArsR/SmtB family transcription factor [Verrucomicrobiota bacterium]